jgi:hypothetical protein
MNLLQPGLSKSAMKAMVALPGGKEELRGMRDKLRAFREAKDREHREILAKVDQVLGHMDAVLGEMQA